MRTTLDIDDDLRQMAKELAEVRGTISGMVLSSLVRQALHPHRPQRVRDGVPTDGLTGRLRTFCASGQHVFWEDDVSLRDVTC